MIECYDTSCPRHCFHADPDEGPFCMDEECTKLQVAAGKSSRPKTIAIDFDGVINSYSGWMGKGVFEPPIPGAALSITLLKQRGHTIIINTTRSEVLQIREYLHKWEIPYDYINHNPDNIRLELSPTKVLADIYIDDRNIPFRGDWSDTLERIENFKVWWRK